MRLTQGIIIGIIAISGIALSSLGVLAVSGGLSDGMFLWIVFLWTITGATLYALNNDVFAPQLLFQRVADFARGRGMRRSTRAMIMCLVALCGIGLSSYGVTFVSGALNGTMFLWITSVWIVACGIVYAISVQRAGYHPTRTKLSQLGKAQWLNQTVIVGTTTKRCNNCQFSLPLTANYCDRCGTPQ
jgi:hypothetical protein